MLRWCEFAIESAVFFLPKALKYHTGMAQETWDVALV